MNPEKDKMIFTLRTRGRISAHVLWDLMVQPPAVLATDVPWCAEAITPEWLTNTVCRNVPGAKVIGIEIDNARNSDGSSFRRLLKVDYNDAGKDAGLPQKLFAKATPTLQTRLSSGMVAAQEGGFYGSIRPGLSIETPRHYWSAHDPVSGRSIHLFEDLVSTKQAQFCNQATQISQTQAEDIVVTLAGYHSMFYGDHRLEQDYPWLKKYEDYFYLREKGDIRVSHDYGMAAAEHVIPADVTARRDEIWPLLVKSVQLHRMEPRTLLHSDVHLGNWYIAGGVKMGLCDWALVCKGHWARDFAYAMGTTLDVNNRRAWENDLLRLYLEKLHELGDIHIDFDTAWLRYRQQMFTVLTMWSATLKHSPMMPEMQPEEMSLEMIRRITFALSDLDSFTSHN